MRSNRYSWSRTTLALAGFCFLVGQGLDARLCHGRPWGSPSGDERAPSDGEGDDEDQDDEDDGHEEDLSGGVERSDAAPNQEVAGEKAAGEMGAGSQGARPAPEESPGEVPTPSKATESLKGDAEGQPERVWLAPTLFSEDRATPLDGGWAFNFHGYIRAPLRFHGNPKRARPPYLVDDDYFQSGFAYTRINETEYAELFLGATHGRTRFVAGLQATRFSDWAETTLQGQSGISLAFAEHDWVVEEGLAEVGLRAGMFWERFGYMDAYDTYVLGRMHMAGLRLRLRMFDVWHTKVGFGAHSDVISSNQGFTPLFYASSGVDFGFVRASLFFGLSWTGDSKREFSIVEDGSLRVVGGEAAVAIPHVGTLEGSLGFYRARHVLFLANGYEVLHSTGGRGLTQNFFGPDSDSGTGEALVLGAQFDWALARTVEAVSDRSVAAYFKGARVRLFGMLAWLASNQASENPLENFDQRVYIKWGIEPMYRPHLEGWDMFFVALRFDRVILDKSHSTRAFRVYTPKVGVTPIRDFGLDVFVSYSMYSYGGTVTLRPNQIPGDLSVTEPDANVLKFQAQMAW
ncbi:MAG: hypothetical protein IPK13_18750 [Deltaproteobacteria bacterium]|nr:hypothetical protein [Deltaproteobacteria bacterium]